MVERTRLPLPWPNPDIIPRFPDVSHTSGTYYRGKGAMRFIHVRPNGQHLVVLEENFRTGVETIKLRYVQRWGPDVTAEQVDALALIVDSFLCQNGNYRTLVALTKTLVHLTNYRIACGMVDDTRKTWERCAVFHEDIIIEEVINIFKPEDVQAMMYNYRQIEDDH